MLDDADRDAPAFDPPDADAVYRHYVRTCRRLGVEPVPPIVGYRFSLAFKTYAPEADPFF